MQDVPVWKITGGMDHQKNKVMKQTKFNALLLIGTLGAFVWGVHFGIQLYRAFGANQDIWWTARTMPLSIEEAKDSFEFFVSGKSIHEHLSDGTLMLTDSNNNHVLVSSADIAIRLNNWHKVKSSILAHALIPCFFFSVCLTLMIIGLVQALSAKKQHTTSIS